MLMGLGLLQTPKGTQTQLHPLFQLGNFMVAQFHRDISAVPQT